MIFPEQLTTVGNWVSTTVMVNEQVLIFPEASEKVNVRVVTPTGYSFGASNAGTTLPSTSAIAITLIALSTIPQLSVAVGGAKL